MRSFSWEYSWDLVMHSEYQTSQVIDLLQNLNIFEICGTLLFVRLLMALALWRGPPSPATAHYTEHTCVAMRCWRLDARLGNLCLRLWTSDMGCSEVRRDAEVEPPIYFAWWRVLDLVATSLCVLWQVSPQVGGRAQPSPARPRTPAAHPLQPLQVQNNA